MASKNHNKGASKTEPRNAAYESLFNNKGKLKRLKEVAKWLTKSLKKVIFIWLRESKRIEQKEDVIQSKTINFLLNLNYTLKIIRTTRTQWLK